MPPGILNLNANECYAEMAAGKVGMLFKRTVAGRDVPGCGH